MLKSINRLKKQKDFTSVLRSGGRLGGDSFVLLALDNNLSYSRVGIVISKKISKKAVKRNRVRRIIMSEFQQMFKEGLIIPGKDIVVRVVKLPEDLSSSNPIRSELRICSKQLLSS